jgi:predicted dehydrogenase
MRDFEGYREMTLDEILSDKEIEAVTVETEEIYLVKYALMAARAGKHVHMEKPGGTDFSAFSELVSVLKEKDLAFSVGYMYRFNPAIRGLMKRIEAGEFGKIYSVEAHMDCKHTKEVREWLNSFPGGMLFFLGCHLIDLIYRIQGEPSEIIPLSSKTRFDGVDSFDYGMVAFKYPNGVSFAKTSAAEYGGFLRRQLVVAGECGTVEIKPLETCVSDGQYTTVNECFFGDWHKPWNSYQTEIYDRYDDMMINFADIIRGKVNPYSYDYELGLYRLILRSCGEDV